MSSSLAGSAGGAIGGWAAAGLWAAGGGGSVSTSLVSCAGTGSNASQPRPSSSTSGHTAACVERSPSGAPSSPGGTTKPVATRASTPNERASSTKPVTNCSSVPWLVSDTKRSINASCWPPPGASLSSRHVSCMVCSIACSCSSIVPSPAIERARSVKPAEISSTWRVAIAAVLGSRGSRRDLGGGADGQPRPRVFGEAHDGASEIGLDAHRRVGVDVERPAGDRHQVEVVGEQLDIELDRWGDVRAGRRGLAELATDRTQRQTGRPALTVVDVECRHPPAGGQRRADQRRAIGHLEHADRRVDLAQGDRLLDRVEQRRRGLGVVGDSRIGAVGPRQRRGRDRPGDHHGDDGHDQRTIAGDRPHPRSGILAGPEDEHQQRSDRERRHGSGPGLIGAATAIAPARPTAIAINGARCSRGRPASSTATAVKVATSRARATMMRGSRGLGHSVVSRRLRPTNGPARTSVSPASATKPAIAVEISTVAPSTA